MVLSGLKDPLCNVLNLWSIRLDNWILSFVFRRLSVWYVLNSQCVLKEDSFRNWVQLLFDCQLNPLSFVVFFFKKKFSFRDIWACAFEVHGETIWISGKALRDGWRGVVLAADLLVGLVMTTAQLVLVGC